MIPQKTNFLDEHPMLIQEYAIYTPAIAEFFKIICEWIDNRVPGAYIYGFSRLGKSRAIRFWIKSLISERYGNRIAFFDMKHKNHDRPSETTFLIELLMAFDHQLKKTGKTTDKYERVVNFMCCQARNQNTNYVVLMIDEAQFMHDQEYKWLCNIQNEMDGMGFRFTVISVGSHELTYQHEIFAMAESAYILSRCGAMLLMEYEIAKKWSMSLKDMMRTLSGQLGAAKALRHTSSLALSRQGSEYLKQRMIYGKFSLNSRQRL